jgi:L-aspartate oxidase
MIKTDILVIGTGLAGAIAALTAAERGSRVLMLTKTEEILSGNTPQAQGGIIYRGHNDSPEKLKKDIMEAGDQLCWEPAVEQLCEEGPRLVEELLIDKYFVDFDRDKKNGFDLTAEGAHSEPRIIHSKDQTGERIQKKIIKELEGNSNIEILTDHTVVDLLTLSHHSRNLLDIYEKPSCFGAFVLNNESGEIFPVFASETILATGGLGQIYMHTSNPVESTGDGIALAWRAGVRCFNLQYIQFHPTTLYHERGRFLISESMRGEGAILSDKNGHEFMTKFDKHGSLAPRDIVARGIHQTMLETEHPCVYLDISFKDKDWIKERFPKIYKYCKNAGIDITKEPIPVVPAAHYSCGGIGVNLNGRTSLRRLYAIGEVSCTGVHGANRLASTSLLESVVWGYKAGFDAAAHCEKDDYFPEIYEWKDEKEYMDPALIAQDWTNIKNTMWNYVGLIRTRQRLLRAATMLRHLQTEVEQFYQKAKMTKQIIQLRNGVQTAIALTYATLEAKESKGAHYLADKEEF